MHPRPDLPSGRRYTGPARRALTVPLSWRGLASSAVAAACKYGCPATTWRLPKCWHLFPFSGGATARCTRWLLQGCASGSSRSGLHRRNNLVPLGDSKPRGLGKAQHAELHLAGPHTDVRPERAEIHTKGLQHGLLYKGLHGPSTYHHCSCRSRISRKGSAGPKCCRSNFAGRRLPRTGFAKPVHGLDTAVPGCIGGGGRWQLDPGSVVHPHRA